MTTTADFAKMVPGFDFLQGLVKNAGSALPNIGQWVAPTLNPEELEKKIEELRTVQFWLEQNARMLGATIQAMEVQRMTLSTLKTMNVSMGELRDSMTLKMPEVEAQPEPKANPFAAPPAQAKPAAKKATPKAAAAAAAPGVVDPMQWWGALTKQFTELAAGAMKDTATDAAKNLATTMMKQSFDAAGETLKKAVAMPAAVAQKAASAAGAAVNAASKSAPSAKAAAAKPAAKAAAKRSPAKAVRRKPY
jgi:hypothetical protein